MNKIKDILFLDIETVSQFSSFDELPQRFKEHWIRKSENLRLEQPGGETYLKKAAIYAEFGKIICIGVGGWDNQLKE